MIVVLGESENDRKAIASLVRGLCPDAQIKCLRRPLMLVKPLKDESLPRYASQVCKVVNSAASQDTVTCVFVHEDADAFEPKHEEVAERIEHALRGAGVPGKVHAVVPAWEIEAWWFMWPDIVADCYESWIEPTIATPPGRVRNAKERLRRAVRPSGLSKRQRARFPDYRESDSIKIAEAIRAGGRTDAPRRGTSRSYDRFRQSVADCCPGNRKAA